ncbi:MAG: helix-turn-helix domain-containing protein [Campylobacterota bacterium]|nr:helix-turn-helix domain-containing protein [Campylobacterota bacterium]
MNENIVKTTCKELGITQKELAERLGTHLTTVQKWVASNELPNNATKSIQLLLENETLKTKLNKFKKAFEMIDEARG